MKGYNRENPAPRKFERIIGIDGEGQGRGPHIYNYLAAGDENGEVWTLGHGPNVRLTTVECLDFILGLPTRSLVFGFAFLYDLTKILTDVPKVKRYLLFHDKKRQRVIQTEKGPLVISKPVKWRGYKLNYRNRKFTVSSRKSIKPSNWRSVTVWDIFAFFQSKFTKACIDWKIGNAETVASMEEMKDRRATFDAQSWEEIQAYCQTECLHLAELGRQLLNAHEDAGFALKDYYGAGSTAKALMNKHDVRNFIGNTPDAMREGIACAFFGGRFENSVMGAIRRPVWNADISSAYPYAATFLPCLIHGSWRHHQSARGLDAAIERSSLALVQWSLPRPKDGQCGQSWGPLPVRKLNGSIAFPLGASSGWTWREEFLAARTLRPDVRANSAWLYTSDCSCRPFSFLPEVYLERLKLGKDSRGIVLKLGPNSVYGKLVQSVGFKPPFQCWVWGGNITSRCRSQLLDAISCAPSPANVLMLATDGVWSDHPLTLPAPADTGTGHTPKPLGGWEVKKYERGVFAARPGIYFPLDPTDDDIAKVRARGLGRKVLYERHATLVDAWNRLGAGRDIPDFAAWARDNRDLAQEFHVEIDGGQRFVGAKTGVRMVPGKGIVEDKNYGEWIDWSVKVGFDPRPKRNGIRPTEFLGESRLTCWEYFEAPSLPYSNAIKSEEDKMMELAAMIQEEQPSFDFWEEDEWA